MSTAGVSAGSAIPTLWDFDRTVDFLVEDADILQKCDVAMGLTGNLQVPIEDWTTTNPAFQAEGASPGELSPTYSHYNATPHMLSARFEISRQSLVQSSGWIERKIRATAARIFRSRINYFLVNGAGSFQQRTLRLGDGGPPDPWYYRLDCGSFAHFVCPRVAGNDQLGRYCGHGRRG